MTNPRLLALEDGTVFHGRSIGPKAIRRARWLFNTAMTGYQGNPHGPCLLQTERYASLSANRQHRPNPRISKRRSVYPAGLIIRGSKPLAYRVGVRLNRSQFSSTRQVVAIADIDTRKLHTNPAREGRARRLQSDRRKGGREPAVHAARKFSRPEEWHLAKVVSTKRVYQWNEGTKLGSGSGPKCGPDSACTLSHTTSGSSAYSRRPLRSCCRVTVCRRRRQPNVCSR